MNCPKCSARLGLTAIRTEFACHACGTPLLSNYATYSFCSFLLLLGVAVAAQLVSRMLLDFSPRDARWATAVAAAVVGLAAFLLMPRFIRVQVSPVRWRGTEALDAWPENASVPAAAPQLTQEQLRAWRSGTRAFTAKGWPGQVLCLLGLLGVLPALLIGFKSSLLGALALAATLAVAIGSHLWTLASARRHIRCPQCGRYPAGHSWWAGYYPVVGAWDFGGMCVHCGTLLPVGMDQREPSPEG